jgi:putative hemolysin
MLKEFLERLLGLTKLDRAYSQVAARVDGQQFMVMLRDALDLQLEIAPSDLSRIPRRGPVIVCANHPMGAMEGIVLPALLETLRRDVRTIGHSWFRRWPRVADRMFLVNPQARPPQSAERGEAAREAASWLRQGGMLVVFPAGEVARFRLGRLRVADSPWRSGFAHLAKATGASVLPVSIEGRNSLLYYVLSLIHPRLGALALVRELLNKCGRTVRVRVGSPLSRERLLELGGLHEITSFVRRRVDELSLPRASELGASAGQPREVPG